MSLGSGAFVRKGPVGTKNQLARVLAADANETHVSESPGVVTCGVFSQNDIFKMVHFVNFYQRY